MSRRRTGSSLIPAGRSTPHIPRKRFGQHFITDLNIHRKIADAAQVSPGDVVLEIGPGLGHLTRTLAEAGARVVAVEVDRDLARQLTADNKTPEQVTILEGDFLTHTPPEWLAQAGVSASEYKVVANLPYYITSAILRRLFESRPSPQLVVVLVQREVAQQITAQPPEMSVLAVSVQFFGEPRIVGIVPAGAFHPRPQVDSAILRVQVHPSPPLPDEAIPRFFELVRAGFSARRKQLRNTLSHGLGLNPAETAAWLEQMGIDPRRRAESLTIPEWLRLYESFLREL